MTNVSSRVALSLFVVGALLTGSEVQTARQMASSEQLAVLTQWQDQLRAWEAQGALTGSGVSNGRSIVTRLQTLKGQFKPTPCTYSVTPTSSSFSPSGGTGSLTLTTQPGCAWTAITTAPWITITSGSSGTGSGTVAYTVSINTGALRNGTITVGGQVVAISQAATTACSYVLSPTNLTSPVSGGSTPVTVTTAAGCTWANSGAPAWITVTNGSGNGNGTLTLGVAANPGATRTATLTLAGQSFVVTQDPTAPTSGCPTGVTCRYVAKTGSDSNPGTETSPYLTIQKAASVVNAGETVIVDDGIYIDDDHNDIVAYLQRGGTSSAWVTFKSKNKWGAKLSGQSNQTKHGWLIGSAAPYVVIQDFDVYGMGGKATAQGGDGVDVEANNVKVIGNDIHDIGRYCTDEPYGMDAVLIGSQDSVLVERNRIHDIGRFAPSEGGCNPGQPYYQNNDHGVYVDSSSNVTIINNLLYSNKRGWSIHVYPGSQLNLTIANNTFAFPNPYRPGQILLASNISGAVIANNIFYQPTTAGIRYSAGTMSNVVLKNNLTYGGAVLFNDTTPSSGITLSGNLDNTNPLFVDSATNNFQLQTGSPAINAGTTLASVLADYLGLVRPQGSAYDIGAYER